MQSGRLKGHAAAVTTLFVHGANMPKNFDSMNYPEPIHPLLNSLALVEATEKGDVEKINTLVTKENATYPGQGDTAFMYRVNQLAAVLLSTFGVNADQTPDQVVMETFRLLNAPFTPENRKQTPEDGPLYTYLDSDRQEKFAAALGKAIAKKFGDTSEGFDAYLQQVRAAAKDLPKDHPLMTHTSQLHTEDMLRSRAKSVAREIETYTPNPVFGKLKEELDKNKDSLPASWAESVKKVKTLETHGKSDRKVTLPMSNDQKAKATGELGAAITAVNASAETPDAQKGQQIATLIMAQGLVESGYAQAPVLVPTLFNMAAKAALSHVQSIQNSNVAAPENGRGEVGTLVRTVNRVF